MNTGVSGVGARQASTRICRRLTTQHSIGPAPHRSGDEDRQRPIDVIHKLIVIHRIDGGISGIPVETQAGTEILTNRRPALCLRLTGKAKRPCNHREVTLVRVQVGPLPPIQVDKTDESAKDQQNHQGQSIANLSIRSLRSTH